MIRPNNVLSHANETCKLFRIQNTKIIIMFKIGKKFIAIIIQVMNDEHDSTG